MKTMREHDRMMLADHRTIPPGWDYSPSTWPQRLLRRGVRSEHHYGRWDRLVV